MNGDTLIIPTRSGYDFPLYAPYDDSLADRLQRPPQSKPESGLRARGSIVRGIQVSTNAGATLQSGMHLTLAGDLGGGVNVSGTLAERHSPLQPLGNTRRLNDFDRVHIAVDGPRFNVAIGDLDLRLNPGRMSALERSIEGLQAEYATGALRVSGAGGFTYGIAHETAFNGEHGKQGPYRLEGRNAERFIIILAGSETVRLDGKALVRGERADYTIDYNAAELHFTDRHILSPQSQITVDYEYVPDIYLSSYAFSKQVYHGAVGWKTNGSIPVSVTVSWQEVLDDAEHPLGEMEAGELRSLFAEADEGTDTLVISTIRADSSGSYLLDDNGDLVFAGAGLGTHTADFRLVGLDGGRYRREIDAGGSHFVLDSVAGEYSPTQLFQAPGRGGLLGLHGRIGKDDLYLESDLAWSRRIANAYADDPRVGLPGAYKVGLKRRTESMELDIDVHQIEADFAALEPIYPLDQYRRWGVVPRNAEAEQFLRGGFRLGRSRTQHLALEGGRFSRASRVLGQALKLDGQLQVRDRWKLELTHDLIDQTEAGLWQQHGDRVAWDTERFGFYSAYSLETGKRNSGYFRGNTHLAGEGGLRLVPLSFLQVDLGISERRDYDSDSTELTQVANWSAWDEARRDLELRALLLGSATTQATGSIKQREVGTPTGATSTFYLGALNLEGQYLDDRLSFQGDWELDEERLPRYEYTYFEVDTGYGEFSYDPALREYIPVPGGRFIRQRIYSDQEEQVRSQEWRSRIDYRTPRDPQNPPSLAWRGNLDLDLRHKHQVDTGIDLQRQQRLNMRQVLERPVGTVMREIEIQLAGSRNENAFYAFGREALATQRYGLAGTFHWNLDWTTRVEGEWESHERELAYNLLAEEYWEALRWQVAPVYQPHSRQRVRVRFGGGRVNDQQEDARYDERSLQLEHDWKFSLRGRLSQDLMVAHVQADVDQIPYSIFQGRQPGTNWEYGLNGRYVFSQVFQVSVNLSLKQRGDRPLEQYLRVEGRTHF